MQVSHSTGHNDPETTVIFAEPSGRPGGVFPAASATVTARGRTQLDAETRDLLRFRLRAVAIVFLMGTCAFAIRGMLVGPADQVILIDQLFLEPALIGLIWVLSLRTLRFAFGF